MSKKERDSGIDISDKLLYLCKNNQLNKTYAVEDSKYSDLLHDMYESEYKVLDYPADCITNVDKAEQRTTTQKTVAKHIKGTQKANISWIQIYCKFFGCSADYILGFIDQPTHEITNVKKETGLSPAAIKELLKADSDKQIVYDRLVAGGYLDKLVSVINTYYDFGASVQINGEKITDKDTIANLKEAVNGIKLKMLRDSAADSIHELTYDKQIQKHFKLSRAKLYQSKTKKIQGNNYLNPYLDNLIKGLEK